MTLLIAEIGQNAQSSIEIVKDLIRICAEPRRGDLYGPSVGGVDAIKLCKRSLAHEMTAEAAARPYVGDQSFGATYGEHRAALELTAEEHGEACRYAHEHGLEFVDTICAVEALDVLDHCTPDYLKVASRDLTNHRLLEALAETRLPLIISTGMVGQDGLADAIDIVTDHHTDLTILHCLSQYPSDPENLNLATITWLLREYGSDFRIGYSDHAVGNWAAHAAVALGAEVIEKHVTLDRCMRGTDHEGSLERDGIYKWVRDTRLIERALGERGIFRSEATDGARLKLARSVASRGEIPEGSVVTATNVQPLSPGSGIPWPDREMVVGKVTIHPIPKDSLLTATMVTE